MDNEQTITENPVANETATIEAPSNVLAAMVFGDDAPTTQPNTETNLHEAQAGVTTPQADAPTTTEETDILEPNAWLKQKWGWDSEEVADNEIKALREKATKAFEYKNDESRKVAEYINEGKEDELYKFLETKKRVEKLSSADLSDKNTAAELVKFGIQKDNPTLDASEVEFLFHEKYATPEKPIQGDLEDDTDYQTRVGAWQNKINNIEKRLIIEAKMQQPKLPQLKTELVLPEIQRNNQSQQRTPSQEELAEFTKTRDNFLQSATKTVNDFNGFNVQVKDKDVNYTVGYTPSVEEKTFVDSKLKQFANSGFDANALLAERWVEADGTTLKTEQIAKDLLRIFAEDKVAQKIASDAANKRLEVYLKDKKQINITTSPQGTFNPSTVGNTVGDKLRDLVFG